MAIDHGNGRRSNPIRYARRDQPAAAREKARGCIRNHDDRHALAKLVLHLLARALVLNGSWSAADPGRRLRRTTMLLRTAARAARCASRSVDASLTTRQPWVAGRSEERLAKRAGAQIPEGRVAGLSISARRPIVLLRAPLHGTTPRTSGNRRRSSAHPVSVGMPDHGAAAAECRITSHIAREIMSVMFSAARLSCRSRG
jgi:hypothetical protein